MRLLRMIGIIFVVLMILFFTVPLLLPDSVEISKSIEINASAQTVFRQVNNLKNWRNWSPFELGDPNLLSVYEGPEQGVGARHIWTSKEMGDGSLTILESVPYTYIKNLLDMKDGGGAIDEWIFAENADRVLVTWTLKLTDLKYPFHRYFGFFIGSLMGPMQEKGLDKLKEVSEAMIPSVPISLVEFESFPTVSIMDSAMIADLGALMQAGVSELEVFMKRSRINPEGPLFAMYYNWDDDKPVAMRVGFPVIGEIKESGRVNFMHTPSGKALKAVYAGPYESSGKAHFDIDAYILDFGYQRSPLPILESYLVGPMQEADASKWITHIYYFIE